MNKRKTVKTNPKPFTRKQLKGLTDGQNELIETIRENDIVLCDGLAGTGKTHIAIGYAIHALLDGEFEKVIVARPTISAGEDIGLLPGSSEEKVYPYLQPIFDELKYFASNTEIYGWKNAKQLEVCPLGFIRGRTWKDSCIVIDEAQNLTYEQIKLILTRIGYGSQIIFVGDCTQCDLPRKLQGGLQKIISILENTDSVGIVRLSKSDIVRNPIIQVILEKIETYEKTME